MYKINLTHRGTQVINGFDLFDECHYGADKLFLRGHFCCPTAVADQVAIALGDTSKLNTAKLEEYYGEGVVDDDFIKHKLGIGNPIEKEDDIDKIPTIALNRYHIPNKKFWNNTPPVGVANPYLASAAVKFSLRVYFRDDFAYITFGCPWSAIGLDETVSIDEQELDAVTIDKMTLLECHFISKEDALQILEAIFGSNVINNTLTKNVRYAPQEVLELEDSDGNVISL